MYGLSRSSRYCGVLAGSPTWTDLPEAFGTVVFCLVTNMNGPSRSSGYGSAPAQSLTLKDFLETLDVEVFWPGHRHGFFW